MVTSSSSTQMSTVHVNPLSAPNMIATSILSQQSALRSGGIQTLQSTSSSTAAIQDAQRRIMAAQDAAAQAEKAYENAQQVNQQQAEAAAKSAAEAEDWKLAENLIFKGKAYAARGDTSAQGKLTSLQYKLNYLSEHGYQSAEAKIREAESRKSVTVSEGLAEALQAKIDAGNRAMNEIRTKGVSNRLSDADRARLLSIGKEGRVAQQTLAKVGYTVSTPSTDTTKTFTDIPPKNIGGVTQSALVLNDNYKKTISKGTGSFTAAVDIGNGQMQDYIIQFDKGMIKKYTPIGNSQNIGTKQPMIKLQTEPFPFVLSGYEAKTTPFGVRYEKVITPTLQQQLEKSGIKITDFERLVGKPGKSVSEIVRRESFYPTSPAGALSVLISESLKKDQTTPMYQRFAARVLEKPGQVGMSVSDALRKSLPKVSLPKIYIPEKVINKIPSIASIAYTSKIPFLGASPKQIKETPFMPVVTGAANVAANVFTFGRERAYESPLPIIGISPKQINVLKKSLPKTNLERQDFSRIEFANAQKSVAENYSKLLKNQNEILDKTRSQYNELKKEYDKESDASKKNEIANKMNVLSGEINASVDFERGTYEDLQKLGYNVDWSNYKSKGIINISPPESWKDLPSGWQDIKSTRPLTKILLEKGFGSVGKGYSAIAEFGPRAVVAAWLPGAITDKERARAKAGGISQGSQFIGKVVQTGAEFGSYAVPVVGPTMILGPTLEKTARGELKQYAKENPWEVAVAGLYVGGKAAEAGYNFFKTPSLYQLGAEEGAPIGAKKEAAKITLGIIPEEGSAKARVIMVATSSSPVKVKLTPAQKLFNDVRFLGEGSGEAVGKPMIRLQSIFSDKFSKNIEGVGKITNYLYTSKPIDMTEEGIQKAIFTRGRISDGKLVNKKVFMGLGDIKPITGDEAYNKLPDKLLRLYQESQSPNFNKDVSSAFNIFPQENRIKLRSDVKELVNKVMGSKLSNNIIFSPAEDVGSFKGVSIVSEIKPPPIKIDMNTMPPTEIYNEMYSKALKNDYSFVNDPQYNKYIKNTDEIINKIRTLKYSDIYGKPKRFGFFIKDTQLKPLEGNYDFGNFGVGVAKTDGSASSIKLADLRLYKTIKNEPGTFSISSSTSGTPEGGNTASAALQNFMQSGSEQKLVSNMIGSIPNVAVKPVVMNQALSLPSNLIGTFKVFSKVESKPKQESKVVPILKESQTQIVKVTETPVTPSFTGVTVKSESSSKTKSESASANKSKSESAFAVTVQPVQPVSPVQPVIENITQTQPIAFDQFSSQGQAQGQAQRLVSRSASRTDLLPWMLTPPPSPTEPLPEKPTIPGIPFFGEEEHGKRKKKARLFVPKGYDVLIRKKGKFVPVPGKYSFPENEAELLAMRELLLGPEATAKIVISKKPLRPGAPQIRVAPSMKALFRPGRGAGELVQRERSRIITAAEKSGISFKGVEAVKGKSRGRKKGVYKNGMPAKEYVKVMSKIRREETRRKKYELANPAPLPLPKGMMKVGSGRKKIIFAVSPNINRRRTRRRYKF